MRITELRPAAASAAPRLLYMDFSSVRVEFDPWGAALVRRIAFHLLVAGTRGLDCVILLPTAPV